MTKSVLILGANGQFGRNAVAAFSWANWNVTRFDHDRGSLCDAAWGVDAIVNACTPEHPDWAQQMPTLTDQLIETAKDTGATVLIPGSLYNYGTDLPVEVRESTPRRPTGPLGHFRETTERAYRDAGVKTIILRAGDFIDAAPSKTWYHKVITAKLHKGVVDYPGQLDAPHAWAFLQDLADVAVMLCDKASELPEFFEMNFPGYTITARELSHALEQASGQNYALRQMPWWPLTLARAFWPTAKSRRETQYLWDRPHRIASDHLSEILPDFVPTPLHDAIAASLPSHVNPNGKMPRSPFGKRRLFDPCCTHS
ncbi:NAD-dependent epimerase/dehydratase family protein [uncultured Litoreibacter sp.]|uniref:NAD-dependent epimerase/dehydratase family protein n=1 Tax=uncultured Litoreibacter sp. TaxID=1392394 RepID=UPI0026262EEC|nr:NAD-dependent epimerase/dehydratase family protein [uncultured Litoreibacter sp.]